MRAMIDGQYYVYRDNIGPGVDERMLYGKRGGAQ